MRKLAARLAVIVGCFFYIVALTWVYENVISPDFAYLGVVSAQPLSSQLMHLLWFLALIPSLWMPVKLERPSTVVLWFIYLSVYVSVCVVPIHALYISRDRLVLFVLWLLLSFGLLNLFRLLPLLPFSIAAPPRTWATFTYVLAPLCITAYALIIAKNGIRLQLVSPLDVYDLRSEFQPALWPPEAYAFGWLGEAIDPLLLALGIAMPSPILFILGLGGQLMIYSFAAFKSVTFSAVLMLAVLLAVGRRGTRFGPRFCWGALALVVIGVSLEIKTGSILFSSLLVRRGLVTPGLLTGYFFEFFSQHPQVLLAQSTLRHVFTYPYQMGISELIGSIYIAPGDYGNANFWADAYANFGYAGVLGYTLVLGVLLWAFDSFSRFRSRQTVTLVLASVAMTLSNSSLSTALLSHGFGALLLLVYLLPNIDKRAAANPRGAAEAYAPRQPSVPIYGAEANAIS